MELKVCALAVLNIFCYTIGILFGTSIFVTYLFFYQGYNAAFWGLCSAMIAACSLHLYILYLCKKIENWYTFSQLDHIKIFGLVLLLASIVSFSVYLSLILVRKQSFSLKNNFYPALISSGLNMLWSFCLFLTCHCYQSHLRSRNPLLLGSS